MAVVTSGHVVICPFTVLVDSREQAPYTFESIPATGIHQYVVPTRMTGLPSGDYSIDGCEQLIAIERKSLEDLYGTLGAGRERFEREVERLNQMQFAAIVIEADLREIWRPSEFRSQWVSQLNPRSVEGTIVAWSIRYPRVHWWPVGGRRATELRVFATLKRFWEELQI